MEDKLTLGMQSCDERDAPERALGELERISLRDRISGRQQPGRPGEQYGAQKHWRSGLRQRIAAGRRGGRLVGRFDGRIRGFDGRATRVSRLVPINSSAQRLY